MNTMKAFKETESALQNRGNTGESKGFLWEGDFGLRLSGSSAQDRKSLQGKEDQCDAPASMVSWSK